MNDSPRRISEFLPEVLQTDVLTKFFAATGDQLFQPDKVEYLSAFVGEKPSYYDPARDVYVQEINKDRQVYQLSPTAISRDSANNEVTHTLFYDDLINKLRLQGALVDDHSRLFASEFYSWGVPLDVDKFVNYQSYVWLPDGAPEISILGSLNSVDDIESQITYSYQGYYSYLNPNNPDQPIVKQATANDPLVFTSGMKVKFPLDTIVSRRNTSWIVEGVGRSIRLVADNLATYLAWSNPEEYDSQVWDYPSTNTVAGYVCMGRGSRNANPWSTGNRWFHKDVLKLTDTVLPNLHQLVGKRPILEFAYDLELWNFASDSRGYINLIDTTSRYLTDIDGQWVTTILPNGSRTYLQIDGITLDDDQVILFTNLLNPEQNNKLYRVTNVRNSYDSLVNPTKLGQVILELLPRGDDPLGKPLQGDGVRVMDGSLQSPLGKMHVNTYWWYDQNLNTWIQGQNRQITSDIDPNSSLGLSLLNTSPLFQLYDSQGVSLSNPSVYPGSSFAGCSIFEYTRGSDSTIDPVLGFATVTENQSGANFVFEVTLATRNYTYQNNFLLVPMEGYKFFQQMPLADTGLFLNNWYKSAAYSRQYVVNEFTSIDNQSDFPIDQKPALGPSPNNPEQLISLLVGELPISVTVGSQLLQLNKDYTVVDTTVRLTKPLSANQFVKIRSYAGLHNTARKGYFEIPSNLGVNPNNEQITLINYASLLPHFESIMINQVNFQGSIIGSNNYRDLAQDLSLGTVLLQSRAPMLKLMGLNAVNQSTVLDTSSSVIDPFAAILWAQADYLRFYNKIVNALFNQWLNQGYTSEQTPQAWLSQALATVNLGKTPASAWANSGFDLTNGAYCSEQSTNPTWVPASATRLGITPAYFPQVFYDTSQPQQPLSMRCHNGAIVVLRDYDNQNLGEIINNLTTTSDPLTLTNPVAQSWLLFELRLYESLPAKYKDPQTTLGVDPRTIFSGKYRNTSYTRQDQLDIQRPSWQKWLTFNQIDAFKNTTFDLQDPFSWNYSSCEDRDHQPVPGHWRGIYFWFFDTDQPHLSPWQMLGFSQKPQWWDTEYGTFPYTRGNTRMWQDLEQGKIAQGPRSGTYSQWARPGLSNNIPVDDFGELLPPFLAGIVSTLPSTAEASADWKFGDRSPLENVWLTQVDSDIQTAQWMYLTLPAQVMEYLWDGNRQEQVYPSQEYSQWLYTDTYTRKSSADFYVHRENPELVVSLANPNNLDYYGSCGIQHWISERLVSESRNVTTYLGNVIRGMDVCLAHRMGGFTDGSSTKLFVESFGLSNNNTLLLPQEDVTMELLRGCSNKEYVYSGVIVEYRGAGVGWRVIGYDSVNPSFEIIPSNTRGSKNTVVIDNQRVMEYNQGLPTTEQVAYGTIFATRQEVYDFLISLGRAQTADGWQFDQYDDVAGRPRTWGLSAREFLFWSQGPWSVGTYITLSPLATLVKFRKEFGIIQNVGGIVNGTYSVLDRQGQSILLQNLDFLRIDDQISVKPLNNQGIFGLRLYTTTLEHAFVLNNRTVFNDIVFDPVLNQRQMRVKLFGYRSRGWQGRLEAPGYMVTQTVRQTNTTLSIQNQIIPNFEKSADDLRKLFEIDIATSYHDAINPKQYYTSTITQSNSANLSLMAKNLVGYVPRDYLTTLLVDDNIAFQFYQGMIHQKGTQTAINKLLRNNTIWDPNQNFNYYEEWAFRAGTYGNNPDINSLDVRLDATQIQSNPQIINIFGSYETDVPQDDAYTIFPQDNRIVDQSQDLQPFKLRSTYGSLPNDLPTAGYVLLGETTYTVVNDQQLQQLYSTTSAAAIADNTQKFLKAGDTVWQFIDILRTWNVWKIYTPEWKILNTSPSNFDVQTTEITTDQAHYLNDGDMVILYGVINAGVVIDNTFIVSVTSTTTFEIPLASSGIGSGGSSLIYKTMRFDSIQSRDDAYVPGGWTRGDTVYVDGNAHQPWQVTTNNGTNWLTLRTENYKTDPQYISNSFIYDYDSGFNQANLVYWDPVKNQLPGAVDIEITYKTPYDPAQYTHDPSNTVGINAANAWGNDQVGLVWWDLNTLRFIDYEIGTDSYRRQNWGSIAPGTTVDIYEWVRSTVPPASWQDLVAKGTSLAAIGSINIPSGQIKSPIQPYVLRQQLNSVGQLVDVYYFWVKNTTTVPDVASRKLSTSVIANIISQPENTGISWWSAINTNTALVGNIGYTLNGNKSIWHASWLNALDIVAVHDEYNLLRPNDPQSSPYTYLWTKLRNSVVEFDDQWDVVPAYTLRDHDIYGIELRPAQTMFMDRNGARQAFVTYVNQLLSNASAPTATDVSRILWRDYFNQQEPVPPARVNKPDVQVATTLNLSAYYINGNNGIGAQLISSTAQLLIVDYLLVGSSPQQVQGYYATVGDRILVKNQQNPWENGIYTVIKPGALNYTGVLLGLTGSGTLYLDENGFRYYPAIGQYILNNTNLYIVVNSGSASENWEIELVNAAAAPTSDQVSWVLARSSDFDQESGQLMGSQVYVQQGTQTGYWWCNPSGIHAVSVSIDAPGQDYAIDQILTCEDSLSYEYLQLKVTSIQANGGVLAVEILSKGNYSQVPGTSVVNLRYLDPSSAGNGKNAQGLISWSANVGFIMGSSSITFTKGNSPTMWDRQVDNLAQLNQLKFAVVPGTKVLVADTSMGSTLAGSETNNRWTIWTWPSMDPNAEFVLERVQSYVGALYWSLQDWYAQGYNNLTLVDYTFDTLQSRDQFLDFQQLDIVKVNNTGNGMWGLFLYVNLANAPWLLIGEQNGTVVLNDSLYDYAKANMGFDGAGFAQDYQGFEYDSRQELDNIIQGLWVGAQGTNGLLQINNTTNEPNQVFFTMLNRIFHEQTFVDWAFKTSYINLRGFADQLIASPYYTTNKIDSLLEYINEIKPYHVKLRQFVDWKVAQETWQNSTTDFDKPPYRDAVSGVRILDETNAIDYNIMLQSQDYKYWLDNYIAQGQLIRNMRTRLIFDRLACNTQTYTNTTLDPVVLYAYLEQSTDLTITNLLQWLTVIYDDNIAVNYKVVVEIPTFVVMRRNDVSSLNPLENWNFLEMGLNFTQTYGLTDQQASTRILQESQSIYTSDQLFLLLANGLDYASGYQVKVRIDDWQFANTFIKASSASVPSLADWLLIAYEQNQGSINRIQQYYSPQGTQTPLHSDYLISGCAGKLLGVDGAEFNTQDAWDKTTWDNVRGWDYTQDSYDPYDQNITDGLGPNYWIYVGDGVQTQFVLPVAPQNPNELTVWYNGNPLSRTDNWSIPNFVSQIYISNGGINYNINDIITAVGGTYVRPAQFLVTGVTALGSITALAITDPGDYTVVPTSNLVTVVGGLGVNAVINMLWGGATIVFASAPSLPVQPRPNIWIVEKGASFHPVVAGLLSTTLDGSQLNRPHLEPGHPEELNPLWNRDSLLMDVYTLPSGGYGNLNTQVYISDGLIDQFSIGQLITTNYQLFVYVNGVPQTEGPLEDYVIAFDTMKVVFLTPPPAGRVSITSVGFGGASQGLGSLVITNKGSGYNIGDQITIGGGIAYDPLMLATVSVTALSLVSFSIVNGGYDYVVGDILSLKYGYATDIVILKVTQVVNSGTNNGIITGLEIVSNGHYLSVPNPVLFANNGAGQSVALTLQWGVAQVSIKNAGTYFQTPAAGVQSSVLPVGGTGFEMTWGPSAVRQQKQLVTSGDNLQENVDFEVAINQQQVLVIKNGDVYTNWTTPSLYPNRVVINNTNTAGDLFTITLFASSFYSLINTQTLTITNAAQLSYALTDPPEQSVVQSLNALVFLNGVKLRPPYFWQGIGDGTTTVFDIGIDTTGSPTILAWENITSVAASAGPGALQVTFASAPAAGAQLYVQVDKDHDYTVSGNNLVFEASVISNNDVVEVQTFSEDSSTRFTTERWPGTSTGIYTLDATPTSWGSIQVWVNGVLADSSWDYTIKNVNGDTRIEFGSQWAHDISDEIQAFYTTGQPAKPAVAFRMFQNIFGDVVSQRLSDQHTTELSQDLLSDSENLYVKDGTLLVDPQSNAPGVIWVGNERIEYKEKIPDPTLLLPLQYKLSNLTRGSLGTSSGVNTSYTAEFSNGNGLNVYFKTDFTETNLQVFVDHVLQRQGALYNYVIEQDPDSLAPGKYIKFSKVRTTTNTELSAPPVGNKNVMVVVNSNPNAVNPLSYPSGYLVRDGSRRQNIPGGYIWTSGVGIQYGVEPQTPFLLLQPGTRQGK